VAQSAPKGQTARVQRILNMRHARRPAAVIGAILAAALLLAAILPPPAARAATPVTMSVVCSGVSLRVSPSVATARKTTLALRARVTVSGTVRGGTWRATCPRAATGTTWIRITAINGRSVRSLYGISAVYAARPMFAVVASPKPTPTPSPKATPSPTPSPSPSPTPKLGGLITVGASLTFHGRGWGHGVGMSQYGALGRARAGQTAAQILAHYYSGTTLGPLASGNPTIRVLLFRARAATATTPLTIHGRSAPWTIDGVTGSFPANARLRLIPKVSATGATTWRLVVDAADGTVLHDAASPRDLRVRAAPAGTLELTGKPATANQYRGVLRVILKATADVIDELPLETYLRGVVPREVSAAWPAEALAAQAIAARSYAAYQLRPGVSTYDVYDDIRSQVYGGRRAEAPASDAAITATAGMVVLFRGAVADTLFHSTGGGATENSENVFVSSTGQIVSGPVVYLRGSPDRRPDGTAWDSLSSRATWKTLAYTREQLSAIFGADARTAVGTLAKLDFRRRGVSGRLIAVTLTGSTGSKTVSGSVFRSVFNAALGPADPPMYSTLVDVAPVP
jgi:stage II sporulation protein D